MDKEQQVAEALTEKARKVKIGLFNFSVKPLNFVQIQEIGDIMRGVEITETEGTLIQFAVSKPKAAECIQQVAIKAIFRSRAARKMFGWYIRRNLTSKAWEQVFNAILAEFDYRFFFQSLISLRGTTVSKKTNTSEAQALGE